MCVAARKCSTHSLGRLKWPQLRRCGIESDFPRWILGAKATTDTMQATDASNIRVETQIETVLGNLHRMLARTLDEDVGVTGGLGRNRTTDTRIFSPLLYRLSYQAIARLAVTQAHDYSFKFGPQLAARGRCVRSVSSVGSPGAPRAPARPQASAPKCGNTTVNTAPPPGASPIETRARCLEAISRTIARPRPEPLRLRPSGSLPSTR